MAGLGHPERFRCTLVFTLRREALPHRVRREGCEPARDAGRIFVGEIERFFVGDRLCRVHLRSATALFCSLRFFTGLCTFTGLGTPGDFSFFPRGEACDDPPRRSAACTRLRGSLESRAAPVAEAALSRCHSRTFRREQSSGHFHVAMCLRSFYVDRRQK